MSPAITYLDHAASTPMRPAAIEAMMPFLATNYANPSGSHRFARAARLAVDESRDLVAATIGCRPDEVVFTGCGTESDNTSILGAVARAGGRAVCSAAEHHAVLHPVEATGGVVVGADRFGRIDLDELTAVLETAADDGGDGRGVCVVSVMAVNNEVGTISDVAAVAEIVRRLAPGALVHTDAVQAPTWVDLRTLVDHVDLMSLSAHKFGGPKGTGILVERGGPRVAPLIVGGGQERGRRSGTHDVAGIVATATALAITDAERDAEDARLRTLRDGLVDSITGSLDDVVETIGRDDDGVAKVAGSAHLCIGGVESEALLYLLDEAGVCASAASACASGAMEPSHVLAAMGVDRQVALGALRLSLGHATTATDVERGAEVIVDAVSRLRSRSMALRS
ncbi:cysteine desulfurase family protein [Ilumatobacter sp.]|uniref:cysteine desulfurase family protein n=1 Tax=Ilumatobacter sp. TaxID=1967498 RepID=UPI003B524C89